MSRVVYNSKRLIPAPIVNVAKEYQSLPDGTKVGSQFVLTITGTGVAFKGSPNSLGEFWTVGGFPPDEIHVANSRLKSCLRKQEAIRELFSEDGHVLEFQSEDGSLPMKCNPRITGITFSEGIWFDRFEYTITCVCNTLSVNGQVDGEDDFDDFISNASESWQIDESDEAESLTSDRRHTVTHTVSATGKLHYNEFGLPIPATTSARNWVQSRLGINGSIITSTIVTAMAGKAGYNHLISESVSETDGTYSVTETWVYAADSAFEELEVSSSEDAESSLIEVTVNGTITGLRTNDKTKYENAEEKYNSIIGLAFTRAAAYSGENDLNPIPLTKTKGTNPVTGVITYSVSYNTRPANFISNAKSETISVSDSLPTNFPVAIFVLGRANGPVIQNLGTSRERRRTLNVEAVLNIPPSTPLASRMALKPNMAALEAMLNPGGVSYVEERGDNFELTTGRFTYNVTWMWE
jgi:hypothetical protein